MTSQITKIKQPLNRKACGPVLQAFLASERILPSDAFAQLLGIKLETEAQMRARRQSPPFFRVGASTFYRFEDVAEWLTRNRIDCDAQAAARLCASQDLLK
jgi:hypothetical protein